MLCRYNHKAQRYLQTNQLQHDITETEHKNGNVRQINFSILFICILFISKFGYLVMICVYTDVESWFRILLHECQLSVY